MKRSLTPLEYDFLKKEFTYLEKSGKLEKGQAKNLLDIYSTPTSRTERKPLNPIRILLIIGAILIGLSILSFVASNWSALTSVTKYILLLATFLSLYLLGYFFEARNRQLARVFFYIGAFTFGAEIFYIGQMFHLGGNVMTAFLMWGIGIMPVAFYLKDEVLKYISLFFIYLFIHGQILFVDSDIAYWMVVLLPLMFLFQRYAMQGHYAIVVVNFLVLYEFVHLHLVYRPVLSQETFPLAIVILLPVFFYIGHKWLNKSISLFVVHIFLALQTIAVLFIHFELEKVALLLLFYFIIGLVFTYVQHSDYQKSMKAIGLGLQFVSAFLLTFSEVWQELVYDQALVVSLIFSVVYGIYGLNLVKRGSLFGVTIICVWILRFYVDLSLAFMNKSIAFFIGGILLISLGIWFERARKGEGTNDV